MQNSKRKAQNLKIKILQNEQIAPHAYKMSLAAPAIAKSAKPGQFVMARVADSCRPLLRRPFGIHRVQGTGYRVQIEILYEVVGEGTEILSKKKSGETLDIIGPLGNGFNLNLEPCTLHPVLVAGGMGVAPLIFLAEKLMEVKNKKSKGKSLALLGAKTKSHILCEKEFKALGYDVRVATDDGSKGHKGFVTELLQDWGHLLKRCPHRKCRGTARRAPTIYACGPRPMLQEIAKIAAQRKIQAQVSLEEHMACGIGACLGCIVDTKNGQKRVCKDGPVFNAEEIVWGD